MPSRAWTGSKSVRIMGHTEGIKLQSLGHRRGVAALCVMQVAKLPRRCTRSHLPQSLQAEESPSGRTFHLLLSPSTTKPAYWQSSFVPKLTHAWNTLVPPALRLIRERQHFKESINLSTDLSFL